MQELALPDWMYQFTLSLAGHLISSHTACREGSITAPQVGVKLPDPEMAGRVAANVARNAARKAQDRLEEAQESVQHSLSSAVGLQDAPEDSRPDGDGAQDDEHGGAYPAALSLATAICCPLGVLPAPTSAGTNDAVVNESVLMTWKRVLRLLVIYEEALKSSLPAN